MSVPASGLAEAVDAPPQGAAGLLRRVLPGVWLGLLLSIALMVAPLLFSQLDRATAGRLAARVFGIEAQLALAFSVVLGVLERQRAAALASAGRRSQFSLELGCVLGALFATVLGHYALLPMIEAARSGHGSVPFPVLHGIATVCYGVKTVLVAVLCVRAARS